MVMGHMLTGQKFRVFVAALCAMSFGGAAAGWEPTKPVEIVVAAGAGGASDQMARMMQAAIQKNMLPLSAKIPFNWRELTPVAVTALDEFVLWTNTTLPYKNTKEFIDAAKKADPQFKMGGTGSKREDHVLTVFIEKKTGAKFAYLPYKSGGEAATQLVGNHTASNVNNPSENLEVWRAGQVRPLCLFAKERIQYKGKVTETMSWNDIPTCPEQGLDVTYQMLRAFFLPAKMPADVTAFYVELMRKVTQTSEFKDYMEKQALKPVFYTGPEMLKFLEQDDALNKSLMTEAGFVAK
jgi:putative tricarboxylic transport membrane protein